MSVDLTLIFLNAQTIREPHGLESFIKGLEAVGFSISDVRVSDGAQIFSQSNECTKQVFKVAYEQCYLDFNIRIPTILQRNLYFEFFVQVGWGEKRLQNKDRTWVGMTSRDSPLLSFSENNPNYHSQFLLDIGKKIFSILLPEFAWIDYGDLAGYTWFDDLEQSRIRHIYWANFFGSNYPSGAGREKILHAPAWKLEHLENNGILYVLSPSPDSSINEHADIKSIKEHFSIDSVR